MATTIGVGIVGASSHRGWARAAHVPALRTLPDYEIRAVSTTRRDTAEQSAREIGAPLAFDSHQALIARPEIDLVVVAVNVTHHDEIVRAALSAGKMVYCEWPLARNLAEAEGLAALARKQGVKTVVGLQGRVAPAVLYLRDLVAAGHIGRLLGTHVAGTGPDDLWMGVLAPEYEITADPSTGNTLLAIPNGHALEMLTFALGEFANVSSTLIAARGRLSGFATPPGCPFRCTIRSLTAANLRTAHWHRSLTMAAPQPILTSSGRSTVLKGRLLCLRSVVMPTSLPSLSKVCGEGLWLKHFPSLRNIASRQPTSPRPPTMSRRSTPYSPRA